MPAERFVPLSRRRLPTGSVIGSRDTDMHVLANYSQPRHNLVTLHIYTPNLNQMQTIAEVENCAETKLDGIFEFPAATPAWKKRERVEVLTQAAPTIAIIGSGFSGTLTAVQILRSAAQPLRVILYDPKGDFGPGLAYGTASDEHLLNVPAGGMSALDDEPGHFLNWLKARGSSADAGSFVQRKVYGEYVKQLLDDTCRSAAPDVRMDFSLSEVVDLRVHASGKAELISRDGSSEFADNVVLATGNSLPSDPPIRNSKFYSDPHYLRNPWAPKQLDVIAPDDDVLLIGTGLTTIDVILELTKRGHRGKLHAVSRRGLLPRAHIPSAPPAPQELVAGLANCSTTRAMLRELQRAIAAAAAKGIDWRSVIAALRPMTSRLWQQLSHRERTRFMRLLRPYWEVHRHRLPPEAAAKLQVIMEQGRLQIHRARIVDVHSTSGHVEAIIQPPRAAETALAVKWVINCTGPTSDVRKSNSPLLKRLLELGLIVPDGLALGVLTDDHGAALDSNGQASNWLFTLGPLRRPSLWESTAVPELRRQARQLSEQLLPELHLAYGL